VSVTLGVLLQNFQNFSFKYSSYQETGIQAKGYYNLSHYSVADHA